MILVPGTLLSTSHTIFISFLQEPFAVNAIINPILQIRKPQQSEVKNFTQGYTESGEAGIGTQAVQALLTPQLKYLKPDRLFSHSKRMLPKSRGIATGDKLQIKHLQVPSLQVQNPNTFTHHWWQQKMVEALLKTVWKFPRELNM